MSVVALVLAAWTATLPTPLDGWFHTELRASYPAADSLHEGPVEEIRLRFSTAVQIDLSSVGVFDARGTALETGPLTWVPGSEEQELRLRLLEPLATGDWRVEWRTAGPDGHALTGTFNFRVNWEPQVADPQRDTIPVDTAVTDPALTEVTEVGEASTAGRVPGAAARWLLYVAMVVGLGGGVFRLVAAGRVGEGEAGDALRLGVDRRLRALGWMAAVGAALALPVALGVQSVQVFGEDGLRAARIATVLGSAWGGAWALQVAGVAALALGLVVVGQGYERRGWLVAAAAGALLALGVSLAGHAAEGGALTIAVQTVHAGSAAVWMGGLAALVLAGLPAAARAPALLPSLVNDFSRVALVAVGVMVATGVVNSWDRLGGPAGLFGTPYGRVLLLKLALVAGAAALGFHNWRTVRPALAADPRPGLLRIPATVELTLGLVVLAVTAVLVVLPLS